MLGQVVGAIINRPQNNAPETSYVELSEYGKRVDKAMVVVKQLKRYVTTTSGVIANVYSGSVSADNLLQIYTISATANLQG